MSEHNESRRAFVRKVAYTAPVLLSLAAAPAFAKTGSYCVKRDHKDVKHFTNRAHEDREKKVAAVHARHR